MSQIGSEKLSQNPVANLLWISQVAMGHVDLFVSPLPACAVAIGETAPLIMVGSVAYIAFNPEGIMSAFTVLPVQIFDWTGRPQADFHDLAAAGIIVLLVVLLSLNAIAILIRNHFQRKHRW